MDKVANTIRRCNDINKATHNKRKHIPRSRNFGFFWFLSDQTKQKNSLLNIHGSVILFSFNFTNSNEIIVIVIIDITQKETRSSL